MIPLLAVAAASWVPWSAATLEKAEAERAAVFVAVTGASPPASLQEEAVLHALREGFLPVLVDRDERPEVAELARLTLAVVSEDGAGDEAAPRWAAFTASLHPLGAGLLTGSGESLAGHLVAINRALKENAAEAEAAAGIAAARLLLGQAPEAAQGPLLAASIRTAAQNVLAQKGSLPTSGGFELLLGELSFDTDPRLKSDLAGALERLARSEEPRDVAQRSLRLRTLVEGYRATGLASLSEAAEAAAVSLAACPRDAKGAFLSETTGEERVFAYENGLAIGALAASAATLSRKEDALAAQAAASAALGRLGPWGSLARCSKEEARCGPAFLEDYAFFADGLLQLYGATGDPRWRTAAKDAVDSAVVLFLDPAGGFFSTTSAHGPLPFRLKSGYDTSRPNANAVMASALRGLASATGEARYGEMGRAVVEAFVGDLAKAPRGVESLAAVAEGFLPRRSPTQVGNPLPSREARGPVSVELALSSDRIRPGSAFRARVSIRSSEPWAINGHHPAGADLVPLTVSVPGTVFTVGALTYPSCVVCAGEVVVEVSLEAPPGPLAATSVRLSARFQACHGPRCAPPETVVLDAPLSLAAAGP